ncbi:hypothetical protein BYT27DRAFT_7259009 [Phlegmacium glaucopus]|nr:hypothetical protein BYT27DRAFT_7259009 [Phlegmacium glaucopus]
MEFDEMRVQEDEKAERREEAVEGDVDQEKAKMEMDTYQSTNQHVFKNAELKVQQHDPQRIYDDEAPSSAVQDLKELSNNKDKYFEERKHTFKPQVINPRISESATSSGEAGVQEKEKLEGTILSAAEGNTNTNIKDNLPRVQGMETDGTWNTIMEIANADETGDTENWKFGVEVDWTWVHTFVMPRISSQVLMKPLWRKGVHLKVGQRRN